MTLKHIYSNEHEQNFRLDRDRSRTFPFLTGGPVSLFIFSLRLSGSRGASGEGDTDEGYRRYRGGGYRIQRGIQTSSPRCFGSKTRRASVSVTDHGPRDQSGRPEDPQLFVDRCYFLLPVCDGKRSASSLPLHQGCERSHPICHPGTPTPPPLPQQRSRCVFHAPHPLW